MRVALSVRAGRISSVTLLRRLGSESRRNRIYRALREVGRAVRTVVLLRYLSEPELREGITAITNRVEAFHGFADWLSLGREQLAHNDPVHHEKTVKFNELLANCAIYSCANDLAATANDLAATANDLAAAGVSIDSEDLATVTPYITRRIRRFGDWKLDLTPPAAVPAALDISDRVSHCLGTVRGEQGEPERLSAGQDLRVSARFGRRRVTTAADR